jgi:diguanylate cyclase (GGDEF)-like protein/PAS domain S-box-containing protein
MSSYWRNSILLRSSAALIASLLLASALTLGITMVATGEREHQAAKLRLSQLLDTVEDTVRIACFVDNQELAMEVADGLLKNSDVLAVQIFSERRVLAYRARAGAKLAGATGQQERAVQSPFNAKQTIGRILLIPNGPAIEQEIRADVHFVAWQLAGVLVLVALTGVGVMLVFVARPMKSMSDQLHRMNATAGERLNKPAWHAETEFGRLVDDVNQLADRLVAALDDERTARQRHEIEEKKYQSIFVNAGTGIFIVDEHGLLSSYNPAFIGLLGLSGDMAERMRLIDLPWENAARLAELMLACMSHNQPMHGDLCLTPAGGARRWLNLVLSPIGDNLMQGVVHDVTDLKEAEVTAKRLAVTDSLTGMSNRRGLEEQMHGLIEDHASRPSGDFALLLVDLDNFRHINNSHGLPIGDEILKISASRLAGCVKDHDSVARLAADIFGIVLTDITRADDAARIAERIMQALRAAYHVAGTPLNVPASMGIALFPLDGSDVPSLLRHAELALDQAKTNGGNKIAFFDSTLADAAEMRRQIERDLRQALAEQALTLHYQPIVDLRANRLAGAEALLRWRHAERGMVPPDVFIPIAEASGLIDDIGLWTLDSACRQLAEWQGQGLQRYISLNVSGRQIPDGLPPEALASAIREHGIDPAGLALEITEGILMADVDKALAWLKAMRAQGVRIFLDDFGTGYSSLSYLKLFPVDTLKVDKSFVRDMSEDSSDRSLVAAVVAMARSLDMDVVAEGVENVAQVALLRHMGCGNAQGYLFSRPVSAAEFEAHAERIAGMLRATPGAAEPVPET